ncbi:hypothetical protein pdam_00024015 [Pocillopora damicornis]|uniref:Uncharacterized protein n=1 Tax=Pocillopora damicornis TaxID=46731 RepID=A0A3M6TNH1_POCDA|nr:hypothetical protein pdam_00024015 [Pocillopora damicornis]
MLVAKRYLKVGQLDQEFFSKVAAKNFSLKLILLRNYKTTSLWKFAPRHVVKFLQKNNAAYKNHRKAIMHHTTGEAEDFGMDHMVFMGSELFGKYRCLNTFFIIVSTNKDGKGVEFISTMEGKNQKYKEP